MMYNKLIEVSFFYLRILLYQKLQYATNGSEIWHIAHALKPLAFYMKDSSLIELIERIEANKNKRYMLTANHTNAETLAPSLVPIPERFELKKFFLDFKDFAAELSKIEGKHISYKVVERESIILPGTYLMPLFIIFTNTIYNSVKHGFQKKSKSNKIIIDIFTKNGYVFIKQIDNGCGIEKIENFYTGQGSTSIQKEAENVGAFVEIHSKKNRGTTVTIKFEV